jgi:tripartite-type tricarboxylate transporter receptor subunit TctC
VSGLRWTVSIHLATSEGRIILSIRCAIFLLFVAFAIFGASVARAQSYPNKPIRILAADVGGGIDFAARLIAPGVSSALGQQVVVENRGGAGGIIAIDTVAKASPDGYTLLLYSNGMWTLPFLKKVPFDPVKDFSPISLVVTAPSILVVHPSVPAKSVGDLILLAKSKPGELNYGSVGAGSPNQIAAELFKSMAGGLKIVEVPFKGGGPAIIAMLGGQIQLMFASAGSVAPHLKSGRVRALALTSAEPSALFPGIPTIASSGLPGYDEVTLFALFAPAKTSASIVSRLNKEVVKVLSMDDIKQKFFAAGIEVVGSSPEQLAAKLKVEMVKMAKIVKDANIHVD